MIYIGDQGKDLSVINWLRYRYYIPKPNETVTVSFLGKEYVIPACEGYGIYIDTISTKEQSPINLREYFAKLKYSNVECGLPHKLVDRPWKATSVFHLVRLSNNIAKQSRRGRGNVLLCQNKNSLKNLEAFDKKWINEYYHIYETTLVKSDDVIVMYAGNNDFDKPFVMQANNIYAHPDIQSRIMKVKI